MMINNAACTISYPLHSRSHCRLLPLRFNTQTCWTIVDKGWQRGEAEPKLKPPGPGILHIITAWSKPPEVMGIARVQIRTTRRSSLQIHACDWPAAQISVAVVPNKSCLVSCFSLSPDERAQHKYM